MEFVNKFRSGMLRVAGAQLQPTETDIGNNLQEHSAFIDEAREKRAKLHFLVAMFVALALLAAGTNRASAAKPAFKVAAIRFNPELRVLGVNVDALAERFKQAAKSGPKIIAS